MEEKGWSVYVHTNKLNNKRYIGITSQHPPELRWLNGHGYSDHLKFGRAIKKYGWDMFSHDIIMSGLGEDEAKREEIDLIERYNTTDDKFGYNMTIGGDGVRGFNHSDISKQKMSEAKSGRLHPNFGKHLSDETKEKISKSNLGKHYHNYGIVRSAETRHKMSESKKKPVAMCSDGKVIQIFPSAKDAERLTGTSRKNISSCCLGKRQKAGGYSWKFA